MSNILKELGLVGNIPVNIEKLIRGQGIKLNTNARPEDFNLNKRPTKLDLAAFDNKEARKLIEEIVFNNKPEETGKALLLLWSAVERLIKHIKND